MKCSVETSTPATTVPVMRVNTVALGSTAVWPPSIGEHGAVDVGAASSERSQAIVAAISSGDAGAAEWDVDDATRS